MPGQTCKGSTCGPPTYAYYTLETIEECRTICKWEGYDDSAGSNSSGSNGSGGSSSSSSNGNSKPTDVATTPINPDGSDAFNPVLLLESLLNITDQNKISWLNANIAQATSIYNFIAINSFTQRTKDFAKQAIIALMDNGQVDFENKIIKSKDFIGTKADCVLNALISSGNNLFKKTSEAFTQNRSKYRLKFTTYTESGNTIAGAKLPDAFGIIEIRFNLTNINSPSIELASNILHETIHAELHRIKLTNNAGPNPLPTDQYNWYAQLWNIFGNGNIDRAATEAEHTYMANYLINPIASGIREFDGNTHPLENYKYFAWGGLKERGKFNGYITSSELTNLANLSQIVKNDTHTNPCD